MNLVSLYGPLLLVILGSITLLLALAIPKRTPPLYMLGAVAVMATALGGLFVWHFSQAGPARIIGDGTFLLSPDGIVLWLPLFGRFARTDRGLWIIAASHASLPLLGFIIGRLGFRFWIGKDEFYNESDAD
jgi:hypothetical protein